MDYEHLQFIHLVYLTHSFKIHLEFIKQQAFENSLGILLARTEKLGIVNFLPVNDLFLKEGKGGHSHAQRYLSPRNIPRALHAPWHAWPHTASLHHSVHVPCSPMHIMWFAAGGAQVAGSNRIPSALSSQGRQPNGDGTKGASVVTRIQGSKHSPLASPHQANCPVGRSWGGFIVAQILSCNRTQHLSPLGRFPGCLHAAVTSPMRESQRCDRLRRWRCTHASLHFAPAANAYRHVA